MAFDPELFLTRYADAFNTRDPEALRSFFALEDPRFAVFEDFSGKLLNGETYAVVLESVFDATGEMSFELLRCDTFGDLATIHAIQRIVDRDEEGEFGESLIRVTLLVSLAGVEPAVVSAHSSSLPASGESRCSSGGCGMQG